MDLNFKKKWKQYYWAHNLFFLFGRVLLEKFSYLFPASLWRFPPPLDSCFPPVGYQFSQLGLRVVLTRYTFLLRVFRPHKLLNIVRILSQMKQCGNRGGGSGARSSKTPRRSSLAQTLVVPRVAPQKCAQKHSLLKKEASVGIQLKCEVCKRDVLAVSQSHAAGQSYPSNWREPLVIF